MTTSPRNISVRPDAIDGEWKTIDKQLSEWCNDPKSVVDSGAIAPSIWTIHNARSLIPVLITMKFRSPDIVTPDGNGGIAFEWTDEDTVRLLEIADNTAPQLSLFRKSKLISRGPLE